MEQKTNSEPQNVDAQRSAVSSTEGLAEALRELLALIEAGDLVRDISKDADTMHYLRQAMRITTTLKKASDALASANHKLDES